MFAGELQRQNRVFAATDTAAIAGGFAAALALSEHETIGTDALGAAPVTLFAAFAALAAVWLATFRFVEGRRRNFVGGGWILPVAAACFAAIAIASVGATLCGIRIPARVLILAAVAGLTLVAAGRSGAGWLLRSIYSAPQVRIPLAVFGFTPAGRYLVDQMLGGTGAHAPIGFFDDGPGGRQYRGLPVLPYRAFDAAAASCAGLEAAIAVADDAQSLTARIVELCRGRGMRWWLVPWLPGCDATGVEVERIGKLALVSTPGRKLAGLNVAVKRGFDLAAATLLLALAAPVLAIAAAAVWLCDGRPVFFRQTRVGIHGKPFEIFKLRTMRRESADEAHREYVKRWILRNGAAAANGHGRDAPVFKLADDERVTPVGRILRRFSADELPQLINVLRGEMSLIGPRPALPYELEFYRDWHWRRLEATPGITGLWQVSGRNRVPFDEMVRLDLDYIRDWSLARDLKILLLTVPVLLQGDGM